MSKNADRLSKPFPWKCGHCRAKDVHPAKTKYVAEIAHDGRLYSVILPALRVLMCRRCAEVVLDTEANEQISKAFRQQAHLLTPEEIRRHRKSLDLTQEQLAARLGVAEATLCRWETGGQIQQRSLDNLLRLYFELPQARKALARLAETAAV